MADLWEQVTWGFVEEGDFVKGMKSETIFRVDGKREVMGTFPRFEMTLVNPDGTQTGKVSAEGHCRVRTFKNDERTPAGQRLDGLSKAGEQALKDILGAELIAHGQKDSPTAAKPFVMPQTYGTAQALASHLSMFHLLYTGDVKTQDGIELRATHKQFHGSAPGTYTGQRIPHVHSDKAFREGAK